MLGHIRMAVLALLAVLALTAPSLAPSSAQSTDPPANATVPGLQGEPRDGYYTALVQSFPALTGRVVDAAGVLDPGNRKALVARLEALEASTGDQLVVATVASLHGATVESYANRLFNIWKLGQKERNNGVLLLVAPGERKVRIEVGHGLEGTLTDAVAKLIIEQSIVPRFRGGDFAAGIAHAVDDIAAVLTGDVGAWQRRAKLHGEVMARRAPRSDHVMVINSPILGYAVMTLVYGVGLLMAGIMVYILVFGAFRALIGLHLLPQRKKRSAFWLWLNVFDNDMYDSRGRRVSSASHSSGSSGSSSSSFSGGGGSSGGGGASGSW